MDEVYCQRAFLRGPIRGFKVCENGTIKNSIPCQLHDTSHLTSQHGSPVSLNTLFQSVHKMH